MLPFQDDRSYSTVMARPRRSEQTREDLINAGIDQISRHGYHGTGIKQILDVVNVPKGSFYNFFASKEAFVVELIKQYSHNLLQEFEDFRQGPGAKLSPVEQLRHMYQYGLAKYASSQCQKSCLIGALAMDVGPESADCQHALRAATGKWQVMLSALFAQAQQAGELRSDLSASSMANVYWATWEGTLMNLKVSGDAVKASDTMETVLSTLLRVPA